VVRRLLAMEWQLAVLIQELHGIRQVLQDLNRKLDLWLKYDRGLDLEKLQERDTAETQHYHPPAGGG
jgi:hypothetical protein